MKRTHGLFGRIAQRWRQGNVSPLPSDDVPSLAAAVQPDADAIEQAWQLGGRLGPLVDERLLTGALLSGEQLSRRLGQGLDFEQLRAYQPGEPAHAIDWRVSARSSQPMVRLYREPAQRQCHLVVDTAPSMYFGTRRQLKITQALQIAHLISAAALRQGMACVLHDPAAADLPSTTPTTSRPAMLRHLAEIGEHHAAHPSVPLPTDWQGFRARLESGLPPGQLIIVCSDFLTDVHDAATARAWLPLAQAHRLVLMQIVDAAEHDLPDMGLAVFGGDQGVGLRLDTRRRSRGGRTLRKEMDAVFSSRSQALRDLARATGGRYLSVTTQTTLPQLMSLWANPAAESASADESSPSAAQPASAHDGAVS